MSTKRKMDSAVQKLQQQLRLMKLFPERLSMPLQLCTPGDAESVGHSVTEFHYDIDVKSTFPKWFTCNEDLFNEQLDNWKVRLLLRKVSSAEHNRYLNYILPKHPLDYNFVETVEILKRIFGECTSLFNIHFTYLNITKCDTVDFTMYTGTINKDKILNCSFYYGCTM